MMIEGKGGGAPRIAIISNKTLKKIKRKKQSRVYRKNRLKMLLQMRECKKILKKMEVKSDEMV